MKIIFIMEGSYLLPDRLNGFNYLKAVKRVMGGTYDSWKNGNSAE